MYEKLTGQRSLGRRLSRLGVAGALLAGLGIAGFAYADELEDRLREAREQLDEAAERLAGLNREMYEVERAEGRYGKRAMLGILLNDSGDEHGLVIEGVTPDGGAEQAGMKGGDRIVAIGGVRLDTGGEDSAGHLLSGVLKGLEPGDITRVEYVRDDNLVATDVTTQAKHAYVMKKLVTEFDGLGPNLSEELSREFKELEELRELQALGKLESLHQLGDLGELISNMIGIGGPLKLEDMDSDLAGYFGVEHGVLVLSPPAPDSELNAGDILLEVDGGPVESAQDAMQQLALSDAEIPVTIMRHGERQKVTVDCAALAMHDDFSIDHGQKMIQIRRGDHGDHHIEVVIDIDEDD